MIPRIHQAFVLALLLLSLSSVARTQVVTVYPWRESFDTARAPFLPAGWTTSNVKSPAGDFTTTLSTPFSPPASALSTDARASQQLLSPIFSLVAKKAETLEFFERRSGTFNAGLLIEAALDQEDTLAWFPLSDTLTLVSSSAYLRRTIALPAVLDGQTWVRLRWRTLGNGTGATGTLRIDDISMTVERETDLALDSVVSVTPLAIGAGADAACTFTVRNCALEGSYSFTLTLYDSDSAAAIATTTLTHAFAPSDSLELTLTYPAITPGLHRMRCVLSCADDEDTTNNDARFDLSAAYPPGALVINEIMYEPAEEEAEYLELYNPSEKSVDLESWTIADKAASQKNRMLISLSASPSEAHMLAPRGFIVVADDSSIIDVIKRVAPGGTCDVIIRSSLSLNNSGDDVYLFDPSGAEIEHLRYAPSWHIAKGSTVGRSLERINPSLAADDRRNWSSSIAAQGGTPGARNSIYTISIPSASMLELSPNPFSPNGDGIEDFCSITYTLPATAVTLRVRIYDSAGRLVRTLANNEPGTARGAIIWDGRDDRAMRVRMGIYIVFFEALDAQGGVLRTLKASAVVATRL